MLFRVVDSKITNPVTFSDYMIHLSDGLYEIKPYKKTRSQEQNRYYRSLLSIVAKETGSETEEIHEKMKMKFLYVPGDDKKLPYCKSTAQLNTMEFGEYIENVRNFMAQFGIILPDPDQFNSLTNEETDG